MKAKQCEVCSTIKYAKMKDSILFGRYTFITKENLVQCTSCGAKYVICSKCGAILSRVHLGLDIFDLAVKCIECNEENGEILQWIRSHSKEM